jgi:hypothetical protein
VIFLKRLLLSAGLLFLLASGSATGEIREIRQSIFGMD